MKNFKNVIFDLDGLICDTEPLYNRATNIVLKAAGVEYQFNAKEYGEVFTGRPVTENAAYCHERFSIPVSSGDLANAVLAIFNVLISVPANITAMPGLESLLEYLKNDGASLAVASGAESEHVIKMLSALGLQATFPVIAGSDDSIKRKPAPDVYLRALAGLGALPGESVALEDSLTGVRAAHAAGIFVIAVKNGYTNDHDHSEADLTAHDLFEVRDILRRGNYDRLRNANYS